MNKVVKKLGSAFMTLCMILSLLSGNIPGVETIFADDAYGVLQNGELTSSIDGWTLKGLDFDEPGELDQGYSFKEGYLSLYTNDSNEGTDISVTQTVSNVQAGSYILSFAAVGNDGKNNMTMTIEDVTSGASKKVTVVPAGWDNWSNILSSEELQVAEGDDIKITFAGNLVGKEWYGFKNVKLTNTALTVDADITVEKVDGLSEDFIHGIDISTYMTQIQSGAKYYDENGEEQEMFQLFKDAGVNYVRIRVWNCPFRVDGNGDYLYVDEEGNEYTADKVTTAKDEHGFDVYTLTDTKNVVYREGYGAGNCDVDTAIAIAKIAQQYDMKILIDFHYSDFWADPAKKTVPKAWKNMSVDEKAKALADYTTESLQAMKDAGVEVSMVQVGNEINNGMAGETGEASYTLLAAGCNAVRALDPDIQIAIHYADPHREGFSVGKAAALASHNIDYDVFASSYYSFWHGTTENLTKVLKTIATTYNKKVMVAEVSYPWTLEDGDGADNVVNASTSDLNYSIDAEGQAAAVRDAIAAVSAVGDAGIGTFYWEAAWTPVNNYIGAAEEDKEAVLAENIRMWENYGSGWASKWVGPEYDGYDAGVSKDMSTHGSQWDNQGFFDFDGRVLPSINVYKYVYTGADGPIKVNDVENAEVTVKYGVKPKLPATTTVNLNNGTSVENVPVSWDAGEVEEIATKDYGSYTLTGLLGAFSYDSKGSLIEVTEGTYSMDCTVNISGTNYVPNGGFEEGQGNWTISGSGGPNVSTDAGNAHTGVKYVTSWSESPMDYTVEQTFDTTDIPAGKYMLTAFYQGTNVASVDESASLYVRVTDQNDEVKEYKTNDIKIPNTWKIFHQAKVTGIEIGDTVKSITVGTHMVCAAGWAVVDDIQMFNYAEAAGDLEEKASGLETTVTAENADAIREAIEDYEALSDELKNYLNDETVKKIETIAGAYDQYTVKAVAEQIKQVRDIAVNADSRAKIEAAKEAYVALTDVQKELLDKELVKALMDKCEAIAKADSVSAMIEALGEVSLTDECREAIQAAKAAYDGLSDAQKTLVSKETLAKLEAAQQDYKAKEAQAAKEEAAKKAAEEAAKKAADEAAKKATSARNPQAAGTVLTVGANRYTVTSASATAPEVAFKQATDKKAKKVTIPAAIQHNGVVYKVTSIANNALKGYKKMTTVTIGENIISIGKNAFSGDSRLKKITIKSASLKKIGKNAFKGISKKATIKVPKKQKKAYTKLLKKKGQASTVKIK